MHDWHGAQNFKHQPVCELTVLKRKNISPRAALNAKQLRDDATASEIKRLHARPINASPELALSLLRQRSIASFLRGSPALDVPSLPSSSGPAAKPTTHEARMEWAGDLVKRLETQIALKRDKLTDAEWARMQASKKRLNISAARRNRVAAEARRLHIAGVPRRKWAASISQGHYTLHGGDRMLLPNGPRHDISTVRRDLNSLGI
jgi:hypothetical protein